MKETKKRADAYDWTIIKRYMHWSLRIHEDQHYLGRAIAWLNRDGNLFSSDDLTEAEGSEYRLSILPQYRRAITELFMPDRLNEAWLGNLEQQHGGHGHWHLIPRYKHPVTTRIIPGTNHLDEFVDGRWGQNYAPYDPLVLPRDTTIKIRDAIAAHL